MQEIKYSQAPRQLERKEESETALLLSRAAWFVPFLLVFVSLSFSFQKRESDWPMSGLWIRCPILA